MDIIIKHSILVMLNQFISDNFYFEYIKFSEYHQYYISEPDELYCQMFV